MKQLNLSEISEQKPVWNTEVFKIGAPVKLAGYLQQEDRSFDGEIYLVHNISYQFLQLIDHKGSIVTLDYEEAAASTAVKFTLLDQGDE